MDHTALSMGISDDNAKDIEADNKMTEDRIRIDDINITMEMNTSQTVIQQQEGIDDEVPMNGYNLRNHPTKHTQRVSMAQTRQVTGVEGNIITGAEGNIKTIHPQTHSHTMQTQVNAKQGLIKYREKVNHA